MPTPTLHPDWASLGRIVVLRRTSRTGFVERQWEGQITSQTPTTVRVDGRYRFRRHDDGLYVLTPRRLDLDCTTTLVPPENSP